MEVEEIKKQILDIFNPIFSKIGLIGPNEINLSNTQFSFTYSNDKIGLELSVDISDFFIYALLYKPSEEGVPRDYFDRNGVRKKLYLQEALKLLSIDCSMETMKLQKLGGNYKNCSEMSSMLADLIDKNWAIINSQHDRWFK
jgi:hypothetical protein